jgi:hypothetical protein
MIFYCLLLLKSLVDWSLASCLCLRGRHFFLWDPGLHWVHRSRFWKTICSKVFIRNYFYFTLVLWLRASLVFNLVLCLRSRHYLGLKWYFMGCTEGAPNGCSPRASSGFLRIIHSKVFLSCLFVEGYLFCLRSQHYVIHIML